VPSKPHRPQLGRIDGLAPDPSSISRPYASPTDSIETVAVTQPVTASPTKISDHSSAADTEQAVDRQFEDSGLGAHTLPRTSLTLSVQYWRVEVVGTRERFSSGFDLADVIKGYVLVAGPSVPMPRSGTSCTLNTSPYGFERLGRFRSQLS